MRAGVGRGAALAVLCVLVVVPSAWASNDPLRDKQYGMDRTRAEAAWARGRGAGVIIAIADTGVNLNHEDLRNQLLLPGRDFIDNDDQPMDRNGHGTHVAGVAAAQADNGIGVAGVAPGAKILPLRVLDEDGTGVESDVAAAIRHSLLRAAELRMRLVINLSLTDLKVEGGASSRQIRDAIREAWLGGAVVVAAAGNEALPFSDYPAEGPNVISVGATDDRDQIASFSNKGASIVAPGEKIVSTFWDPESPNDNAVYASGSGTSMAAPHVSGVAALLLSTGLTNSQTVDRILRSADDLGPRGPDEDFGYGRLNAARAMGVEAGGAPLTDASDLPEVGSDKFEPIGAAAGSPVPEPLPAPVAQRRSRVVPALIAVIALMTAYASAKSLLPVPEEAEPGDPWEFDPLE